MVDPHDLLLGGVRASGKDASLDGSDVGGVSDDPGAVHPLAIQQLQQALGRLVAADAADGKGKRAQSAQVRHGVSGAPRSETGFAVLEDEHGSFPRDAGDLAVDELV